MFPCTVRALLLSEAQCVLRSGSEEQGGVWGFSHSALFKKSGFS